MNKQDALIPQSQTDWAEYNPTGLKPTILWRRMNHQGHRYYYAEQDGDIVIACGITTAIDRAFGESKFLREWKDSRPNWKEQLSLMADYGTLCHIGFGFLCKKEAIPSYIIEIADEKFHKKEQFKKDMMSLKKFLKDYEVEVIFLEGILGSHYPTPYGKAWICSAIDCFCKLSYKEKSTETVEDGEYVRGDKKGQMKYKDVKTEKRIEVYAIVDLKSNYDHKDEKQFFESHKYQLLFGKRIIEEHLGIQDIKMFNISPLGWNKEPKYEFKEHLDKENRFGFTDNQRLEARLNLAVMEGLVTPSGEFMEINDKIDFESQIDYRILNYEDKAREVLMQL
jgi:hypothetical protein